MGQSGPHLKYETPPPQPPDHPCILSSPAPRAPQARSRGCLPLPPIFPSSHPCPRPVDQSHEPRATCDPSSMNRKQTHFRTCVMHPSLTPFPHFPHHQRFYDGTGDVGSLRYSRIDDHRLQTMVTLASRTRPPAGLGKRPLLDLWLWGCCGPFPPPIIPPFCAAGRVLARRWGRGGEMGGGGVVVVEWLRGR